MGTRDWVKIVNQIEKRREYLGYSYEDITELLGLNYWELDDLWKGFTSIELYKIFLVADLLQFDLKIELREKNNIER